MKTMVSTAGAGLMGAPEGTDVLAPGSKAGPWQVEREIGRGGMGTVYAVVHDEIGKRAALKVIHQRLMAGVNGDRMLLEAKVVNQVGHPNIVDIFETGRLSDGRPYIVMERLSGVSLALRAEDGKLLPDLVIAILLQVCDALIAAHAAGVVHRDLKLDNVFLIDNPDDPHVPKVKLLDWGIAKIIHCDVRHTIDGQLVGTPQYLSPEQARGHAVSPETDVYSLGVMAYELFLEQLPFEAETAAEVMAMHLRTPPPPPSELWPDVPPALEGLLLAMLAKQPDHRPTMMEVAHRLEAVRAEFDRRVAGHAPRRSTAVRRPTPAPVVVRPASRAASRVSHRAWASSSAGVSATELSGARSETRRWQYAIGGLALALSGLLFWISRVGDRAASAATAPSAIAGSPASHTDRATDAADARPDRGIAPQGAADDAVELRTAVLQLGPSAAHPVARPAALRPARVASPPSAAARPVRSIAPGAVPAPRTPAAPRRGTKVDPDGTLDVYE